MRKKLPFVAVCILGVAWLMKDVVLRYTTDTVHEERILTEIALHDVVGNREVMFRIEKLEGRLFGAIQSLEPRNDSTNHPLLVVARTWQTDLAAGARFIRQEAESEQTDVKKLLSVLQENESGEWNADYGDISKRLEDGIAILRNRKDALKAWVALTVRLGVKNPDDGYDLESENAKGEKLATEMREAIESILDTSADERELRATIRDKTHASVSTTNRRAEIIYLLFLCLTLIATVIGVHNEYIKSISKASKGSSKGDAPNSDSASAPSE
ncbi:hypothetical protein [uncultured Gimesia sp.]|uniref:hypothetical protein n=1 Tax=uncultured Gimesia sp. TaxID=1678688 RepID=UPI0026373F13|nr:hypothetical protein [uncultured Gimesia sp.]